jgi:pyrroline-5-carboxylate reductase
MGGALMRSWLAAGLLAPASTTAVDIVPEVLASLREELGIRTSTDIVDAVSGAELVIIAVKPQQVPAVLPEIRAGLKPGSLVISIAAGIKLAILEETLPPNTAVVRVMPNTPCLVGAAASGLAVGRSVSAGQQTLALRLFEAVGVAFALPEKLLDAVTGLSGSGPAYVYLVIEALADGGVAAGLPRDVSQALAAQTVYGAAQMVLQTKRHPALLREAVTSPAGTTAAGLQVLEDTAVRGAIARAVQAAANRSRELGSS